MRKLTFLTLVCALLVSSEVNSQSCDPWITQAYKQLYDRTPSTEECNIRNYNNGSWRSYVELVGHIATFNRNRNNDDIKGDPWIFMAYVDLYKRGPQALELNIKWYNNGTWNSYDELKKYVKEAQDNLTKLRVAVKQVIDRGRVLAIIKKANMAKAAISIVSKKNGEITAKGGKAVLAGISKILKDRAKAEGVNVDGTEPGISVGSKYRTQSAGVEIIPTSGNGAIIIEQ